MERSEKSIETSINRKVKKAGGISIKMQHTGLSGFPDRQYIIPTCVGHYTIYVEFKKYGEEPTKLQEAWGRKLKKLGCQYHVINSKDTYDNFCRIHSL